MCRGRSISWLAPINLLELLIIRPASLTIRLFANMVSGHLMVATCLAFAQFWMVDAVNKLQGIPVGALWFAGGFAMTCFEAFVAFPASLRLRDSFHRVHQPELPGRVTGD